MPAVSLRGWEWRPGERPVLRPPVLLELHPGRPRPQPGLPALSPARPARPGYPLPQLIVEPIYSQ